MAKSLPNRPNLDHLRRQAKALLAGLEAGDAAAAAIFLEHLPAAKGKTPAWLRSAGLRLADAQSAVARQTGFASWPHLARHVEQLRALEGTWEFERLEIEGQTMPAGALASSRILIDGDRFRTESPEATYEGVFNINVESDPHEIDIEFVAGPEAGNRNYGIFRLDGERLSLCLDMNGKRRPAAFKSAAGSGHACETLRRATNARPQGVTGGTAPPKRAEAPGGGDASEFGYVASPTLTKLQGEWAAVKVVRDGKELPAFMLGTGTRSAQKNEIKIAFGGQVMIHALVRLNEKTDPVEVDYFHLSKGNAGEVSLGIMRWEGSDAWFCMAAAGKERAREFSCEPGSGRTLSCWRPKR